MKILMLCEADSSLAGGVIVARTEPGLRSVRGALVWLRIASRGRAAGFSWHKRCVDSVLIGRAFKFGLAMLSISGNFSRQRRLRQLAIAAF